jgi:hypothetical protein
MKGKISSLEVKMDEKGSHEHPFLLSKFKVLPRSYKERNGKATPKWSC